MPDNRFAKAAKDARDLTNKQLGAEIAKLTILNEDKLNQLLPTKKDREAFVKLMEQVQAETDMDNKLAYLAENLQTAGAAALRVLRAFV